LGTVAQPELGEDPHHVRLHRRLAEVQRRGNLGIGQSTSDQPQHVDLPGGECAQQRRDALGRGRVAQEGGDQAAGATGRGLPRPGIGDKSRPTTAGPDSRPRDRRLSGEVV
jgi:hypothetical protein